ncbi:MurR/RpiR family transcriptional regulator [Thermotoga sp. KOL6]|uniref:MurR/RpiR family transcriptional regulator n=1 Tax=Thermotoga sp. KOL6 TaxID=126741 RepID=UPI000C757FDC|nr:MurR/RpiR family transcriptional regulator [Thermotoga sp. KOL6]PLV59947.1 RpiR family transcriptional regulator [Thermotoga sp. KOL6]
MKIKDRILNIYTQFSPAERKVADYILDKPDDVIHYSITEFAKIVGVSETTVHRVIKKLDFEGYQTFKISLARELSGIEESLEKHDFIDEEIEILKRLKETLDIKNVEKAVNWIIAARRVLFFGVGLSGVVSEYASLKFALLGFSTFFSNDPHVQVIEAVNLSNKDVVISISHTGNIRDTVKSTQVAKDMGARTIAITTNPASELAKVAHLVLQSPPVKYETYEFLRENIGEIAVVDVLFKETFQKIYQDRKKHFENLEGVFKPKKF